MSKARWTHLSKWVLCVVLTLVIGWDVVLATNGVRGDTISEITRDYAYRWHLIPMALGVLLGHLLWNIRGPVTHRALRMAGLVGLGVGVFLWDLAAITDIAPMLLVPVAVPLGRLLWPQSTQRSSLWAEWTR